MSELIKEAEDSLSPFYPRSKEVPGLFIPFPVKCSPGWADVFSTVLVIFLFGKHQSITFQMHLDIY